MFENIHYSYSLILSHYTLVLLTLGSVAAFYSYQIASAMQLIGMLGLLTLNVSAAHFIKIGLPLALNFNSDTIRLFRILILCWLPYSIFISSRNFLGVKWRKLDRIILLYSTASSGLYLILFITSPPSFLINFAEMQGDPYTIDLQDIFQIVIYLVLACFSISLPIAAIKMGIGNTLEQGSMRYWYQNTTATMLICAACQVLAFIPLYLFYFPSMQDLGQYAEAYYRNDLVRSSLNIMPIYYFFFTLPFLLHVLYALLKNSPSLRQKFPKLFTELVPKIKELNLDNHCPNIHEDSSLNVSTATTPALLETEPSLNSTLGPSDTPNNTQNSRNRIRDRQYLEEFSKRYNISKREFDVLIELIQGHSYAAIAEHLYISLATVKSHIYSIYRKTQVKNKIQLLGRILNE